MSLCNCLICTKGSIETLPFYIKYEQEYARKKIEEGDVDEELWLSEVDNHVEVQILKLAIEYANGTCLYRMYRRISRLYNSYLGTRGDNKKILKRLDEILTMSDAGAYIDMAFQLVLED